MQHIHVLPDRLLIDIFNNLAKEPYLSSSSLSFWFSPVVIAFDLLSCCRTSLSFFKTNSNSSNSALCFVKLLYLQKEEQHTLSFHWNFFLKIFLIGNTTIIRKHFFSGFIYFIHIYVVKLLPKLKNSTLCMKIQLSIQVSREDFRKRERKSKAFLKETGTQLPESYFNFRFWSFSKSMRFCKMSGNHTTKPESQSQIIGSGKR